MISKYLKSSELLNYKSLHSRKTPDSLFLTKRSMSYQNQQLSDDDKPNYVQFIVKKRFSTSQKTYTKNVEKSKRSENLDTLFHTDAISFKYSHDLSDQKSQRKITIDKICESNSDSFDTELNDSQISRANSKISEFSEDYRNLKNLTKNYRQRQTQKTLAKIKSPIKRK